MLLLQGCQVWRWFHSSIGTKRAGCLCSSDGILSQVAGQGPLNDGDARNLLLRHAILQANVLTS